MKPLKYRIDNHKLRQIRQNTDWRDLFSALGIRKDERRSKPNDWWGYSPFTEEKTPSFHMGEKGFYCFATRQGGGVIELVQKVVGKRTGKALNCYEAGKWLLDNGISSAGVESDRIGSSEFPPQRTDIKNTPCSPAKQEQNRQINQPIHQNLLPFLTDQGTHPEFVRRGISRRTCEYLGCGYLDNPKSKMHRRIVFQVRGVQEDTQGVLKPVILSHIGRATDDQQIASEGKWRLYSGFQKTLELYNIDKVLLDSRAVQQAKDTGKIIVVEGCFDVAKLIEAGIYNVVATFGAHLDMNQIPRLRLISEKIDVKEFFFWYDRDSAGRQGQQVALNYLYEAGIRAKGFDWDAGSTPDSVNDVCDFSVRQLNQLKSYL